MLFRMRCFAEAAPELRIRIIYIQYIKFGSGTCRPNIKKEEGGWQDAISSRLLTVSRTFSDRATETRRQL